MDERSTLARGVEALETTRREVAAAEASLVAATARLDAARAAAAAVLTAPVMTAAAQAAAVIASRRQREGAPLASHTLALAASRDPSRMWRAVEAVAKEVL